MGLGSGRSNHAYACEGGQAVHRVGVNDDPGPSAAPAVGARGSLHALRRAQTWPFAGSRGKRRSDTRGAMGSCPRRTRPAYGRHLRIPSRSCPGGGLCADRRGRARSGTSSDRSLACSAHRDRTTRREHLRHREPIRPWCGADQYGAGARAGRYVQSDGGQAWQSGNGLCRRSTVFCRRACSAVGREWRSSATNSCSTSSSTRASANI